MDAMNPFVLLRPSSMADAVLLLAANPGARPIAGGTDLLPNLRHGLGTPGQLIDLSGIAELQQIERADQGWVLGAGVTLQDLASRVDLALELPALAQAASAVA
ncbi:MAG: FAD binding domain-containing protein, partial [Betaproteobacteria bacterium]